MIPVYVSLENIDIQLVIEAVGLAVGALIGLRWWLRKRASSDWPTVAATIQRGQVVEDGLDFTHLRGYRSVFGYAFRVNGITYAGFFVLRAKDEGIAYGLQKELNGSHVLVRYNPARPEISFLEEKELLHHRVTQSPKALS